jgi:phenylalanyl-tRNA synthetase beta chain
VTGFDPAAASPAWLQRRLVLAGMRPISLAVDITNSVMLEVGQPLHAFDLDALSGPVVVRRARAGSGSPRLDGQDRALDRRTCSSPTAAGPIALAGVMGGGPTEITAGTTSILLESARFAPLSIARTARAQAAVEASRRYERGVDPLLAPAAAELAVRMMVELGGATAGPVSDHDAVPSPPVLALPLDAPGRLAGREYAPEAVRRRLGEVGCVVTGRRPARGRPAELAPRPHRPGPS